MCNGGDTKDHQKPPKTDCELTSIQELVTDVLPEFSALCTDHLAIGSIEERLLVGQRKRLSET